ncbi:hypothetical protein P5F04_08250 [Clostridium perfringens]|uniref:hypothetical protein n=1 Tax=Clostridium perfringens TaxID=1502 RepID=UPI001F5698A5|nr:hypothetical protein [Clostridium perfringens]MCI2779139.1 hypothetical protein [Clostridium perfringens]MDK0626908.1 hypothetical protein [Clostridium perfringens]MDK0664759.1 hypothetical protein [Clostridium perfringens]
MKEKTIDKIHEEHMDNKNGRDTVNDLYKKIYLSYINLIEDDSNFDIRQEIILVELRKNKFDNEPFKYFQNVIIALSSAVIGSIFSISKINSWITGILMVIFFILIGIGTLNLFKKDIKEYSDEKLYYSTCLLVLKDLEEELL